MTSGNYFIEIDSASKRSTPKLKPKQKLYTHTHTQSINTDPRKIVIHG